MSTMAIALSDAELVQRCRAGDLDAWNQLVERFSRYVYAICTQGFRLPQSDAEDVFQEVFTRVYTRLDTLRDDSALRPWIGQLTRRLCMDTIAASGRMQPVAAHRARKVGANPRRSGGGIRRARGAGRALRACQEMLDRFFARDESYRTISASSISRLARSRAASPAACASCRQQLEGKK